MRRAGLAIGLALVVGLAACGSPTPYMPAQGGKGEGFAEQRLEGDRYRVRVAGNSLTARETVQNQLLYRAAELTLQNGFERFVVVEQAVEPHTRYYAVDPFPTGYFRRHRFFYFPTAYEAQPITRYDAWAEIKLVRRHDDGGAEVYEARQVIAELRKVVLAPKPG